MSAPLWSLLSEVAWLGASPEHPPRAMSPTQADVNVRRTHRKLGKAEVRTRDSLGHIKRPPVLTRASRAPRARVQDFNRFRTNAARCCGHAGVSGPGRRLTHATILTDAPTSYLVRGPRNFQLLKF